MLKLAYKMQLKRKYIIQGLITFAFFIIIYTIVDRLNMTYAEMREEYGSFLVVINIITNVIMSFLSALLLNLSTAMIALKGKGGKASNFGFFSIIFGVLTYGCTPCVIAFFASVGVAFSVIALPLAGFPYKLISLALLLLGLFWISKEIQNGKCKTK